MVLQLCMCVLCVVNEDYLNVTSLNVFYYSMLYIEFIQIQYYICSIGLRYACATPASIPSVCQLGYMSGFVTRRTRTHFSMLNALIFCHSLFVLFTYLLFRSYCPAGSAVAAPCAAGYTTKLFGYFCVKLYRLYKNYFDFCLCSDISAPQQTP